MHSDSSIGPLSTNSPATESAGHAPFEKVTYIPDFIDLEKAARSAGLSEVPEWAKRLKKVKI